MKGKQRFIKLSLDQRKALEDGYRQGKKSIFRQRCHAVLLSDQGYTLSQIASLFQYNRITIGIWFDRYEQNDIDGLHTKVGQGRKSLLKIDNADHVKTVKQYVDEDPQDLNHALNQLEQEQDLSLSRYTLQRFLKKLATDTNASDAGSPGKWIKT